MRDAKRNSMVEAVKGIAIALMVYGHVAQGVNHRGWWISPAYDFQQRFIYTFHMAAFFFVSGLFVRGSIARAGAGSFVVQRLRTVLWPYLFCVAGWSAGLFFGNGAGLGAGNGTAAPRDPMHAFVIPLITGEASWFLPTLFVCLMLALVTVRLPLWLVFLAAAALNAFLPATGSRIADSAAHYFVFMAAGAWIGLRTEWLERLPRWQALAGAVFCFLLVAAWIAYAGYERLGLSIVLGLAGIMGLFRLASAMRATWLEAAAEWLGAASLGIFVLHPFFQGATRVVLARLTATHAVLPNVLVPTAVAVLGPALLWHYREPLRIGFLFEFPWGGKRPDNARREVEDAAAVEGPAVEEKSRLRV